MTTGAASQANNPPIVDSWASEMVERSIPAGVVRHHLDIEGETFGVHRIYGNDREARGQVYVPGQMIIYKDPYTRVLLAKDEIEPIEIDEIGALASRLVITSTFERYIPQAYDEAERTIHGLRPFVTGRFEMAGDHPPSEALDAITKELLAGLGTVMDQMVEGRAKLEEERKEIVAKLHEREVVLVESPNQARIQGWPIWLMVDRD